MVDTVITYIQIFAIGLSLGVAGPCLLSCAPVLLAYIAGSDKTYKEALKDVFLFLCGKSSAYLILGGLAGLSGGLLRQFLNLRFTSYLEPVGGIIAILFGIMVLTGKSFSQSSCEGSKSAGIYKTTSVFALGFTRGFIPCGPLLALLCEIALISRGLFSGVLYGASFALGTFLSGLLTMGTLSGIATWIPKHFFKSEKTSLVFRIICALLLISFGILIILGKDRGL